MTDLLPDLPPTSTSGGGRCPSCGRISSFLQFGDPFLLAADLRAFHLGCQGCGRGTVAIERYEFRTQGRGFNTVPAQLDPRVGVS